MKNLKLSGILGAVLVILGGFIPAAKLDDKWISIIPVWGNMNLYNGLWSWRDISFLSVSLIVISLIALGFSIKRIFTGLLFTGYLSLLSAAIIFLTIFLINPAIKPPTDLVLKISWAWIFVFSGILLQLFSGHRRNLQLPGA